MGLESVKSTFEHERKIEKLARQREVSAAEKSKLWLETFDKLNAIHNVQEGRAIKVGALAVFGYTEDSPSGVVLDASTYINLMPRMRTATGSATQLRIDYCVVPPEGMTLHRGSADLPIIVGPDKESVVAYAVYGESEEYGKWCIRNPKEPMRERVNVSSNIDTTYPTTYSAEEGHYYIGAPNGERRQIWHTGPEEFIATISPDLKLMTRLVSTLEQALAQT